MDTTRAADRRGGGHLRAQLLSFPLCCPSRATLLTGQYAHNHGVMDNEPPAGGFERFAALHAGEQPRHLAGRRRLPDRARRQVLQRLRRGRPRLRPGGMGRVVRRRRSGSARLRLRAQRERRGRPLRRRGVRLQAGRPDRARRRRDRGVQADDERSLLPRPRLHRAARGRAAPEPAAARQLPGLAEAGAAPRSRLRSRQRCRARRASTSAAWPTSRSAIRERPRIGRGGIRAHDPPLPLHARVAAVGRRGGGRGGRRAAPHRRARRHRDRLHLRQRLLLRRAPDRGRQAAPLRGGDPRAAADPRPRVRARSERGDPVVNVDLAATLLDAAGVEAPEALDGLSLLPSRQEPGLDADRSILLESRHYAGIRTDRHVYVEHGRPDRPGSIELYDLERDPDELRNLAGTAAQRRAPGAAGGEPGSAQGLRRRRAARPTSPPARADRPEAVREPVLVDVAVDAADVAGARVLPDRPAAGRPSSRRGRRARLTSKLATQSGWPAAGELGRLAGRAASSRGSCR